MATIALTGDLMPGRGVSDVLVRRPPPDEVWQDVAPLLADADLRLTHLACPLTTHRRPWARSPRVYHLRADPVVVEYLRAAPFDGVALAGEHALDYEGHGLLDTIRHLDAAGIAHAGAGRDRDQARKPAFFERGGVRYALVSWTDAEPGFAAGPDRPGHCFVPVSLAAHVLERVEQMLARARAEAQVVVASVCWGPDRVQRPAELFRRFARAVIERGADVFHGHGAHVFQGMEIHRGRPILYDTGDFLDDYVVDPVLHNDWSFLFRVGLDGTTPAGVEMLPVVLRPASVKRAERQNREAILRRMAVLCEELGTRVERRDGLLYVPG
jgi:poly-gamma-glutamate synthesis protein (capsule biosynthesis protein)